MIMKGKIVIPRYPLGIKYLATITNIDYKIYRFVQVFQTKSEKNTIASSIKTEWQSKVMKIN